MSDGTHTGAVSGEPQRPKVDPELVARLMAGAGEEAELLGPDGLLSEISKAVMERALAAELGDHLGYEAHDPAGRGSGNSRNGTTPKTVLTDLGAVGLEVPRDRNSTFEPKLVPKGTTRLKGFNERVIGLYARGMTVRDIQAHVREMYEVEISPDLVSTITDGVLEELREWQNRPLDRVFPVVYLDAIVCKVRHEGAVRNKAAHIAIGVDVEGRKHVLGFWVETAEGAKFWLRVITEIRNRGVEDVLFVCCDGLAGLPAAIEAVWPQASVQTCVVHLIRASLRFCSYKDRKAVVADLKPIYRAPNRDAAEEARATFEARWAGRYPGIVRMWHDAWEHFVPFLDYPPEIRSVIYTTNAIESLNYQLRKVTKTRGHFPSDQALIKLLYLAVRNLNTGGRFGDTSNATWHWRAALNQFELFFPGRLQLA
jgi:putative transposase